MTRKKNLGIIGAGEVVEAAYLPILPFLESLGDVIIYDINPSSLERIRESYLSWLKQGVFDKDYGHWFVGAQERADEFFGRLSFTQDKSLLFKSSDLVLVVTPTFLHIPLALEFLQQGITPILEKPVALSMSQFRELEEHDRSSLSTKVRYIESYLFNPAYNLFRMKVQKGVVGEPLLVEVCLANTGPSAFKDLPFWRVQKSFSGGGALFDWGTHTFAVGLYIACFGYDVYSQKTLNIKFARRGEEYAGVLLQEDIDIESLVKLELDNRSGRKLPVLVESSWCCGNDLNTPKGRSWVRVEGTDGTLVMELRKGVEGKEYHYFLSRRRESLSHEVVPVHFPHDSFYYGLKTHLETEFGDLPYYAVFDFGLKILGIVEDALRVAL